MLRQLRRHPRHGASQVPQPRGTVLRKGAAWRHLCLGHVPRPAAPLSAMAPSEALLFACHVALNRLATASRPSIQTSYHWGSGNLNMRPL